MTYYDSVRRGKRREIPKERIKPITKEWEEQVLRVNGKFEDDERGHQFYPPESQPVNPNIYFRRKSGSDSTDRPNYLFGSSSVSSVHFPSKNSLVVKNDTRQRSRSFNTIKPSSSSTEEKENLKLYDPRVRCSSNSRIPPKKRNRVIRPRVTPLRKQIQFMNNNNDRQVNPKNEKEVRQPNFYEKWNNDHDDPEFNRSNQERENKYDKKDPFYRIYAENFKPVTKKKDRSVIDRIGEFERSLLYREAFDPSDLQVTRKYDKKDPTNRIYGLIDEKVLSRKPFNHSDRSPPAIGKHDRKDLKHRLYGFDTFPEEEESGRPISPRTKNKYGQLCRIRPKEKKGDDGDYQKKDLKSRLYPTSNERPVVKPRDRIDCFNQKLHNPQKEENCQFKNFGDYEWKKLYRYPTNKPHKTHFRRQPKRRLYHNYSELPQHEGSFNKMGKGVPKASDRKDLERHLYGLDMYDKMHAKDFLEYQEKMENEKNKRLNNKSIFDVPVGYGKVTEKISEHNPWRRNEFTSPQGFKNQGGRYYDLNTGKKAVD